MSARWYAPSTGTFTSSDTTPTGMPDPSVISGTPYGYVDGDPLTSTDPTGHGCIPYSLDIPPIDLASCIHQPCAISSIGCPGGGGSSGYVGGGGGNHVCEDFGACNINTRSGGGSGGGSHRGRGRGCGFYCGVGIGIGIGIGIVVAVCSYEPEICAAPVEYEPPPPPQDCYGGSDPGCSPPSPPNWLKDDKYEPGKPTDKTNPKDISANNTIIGQAETSNEYLDLEDAKVKNFQQQLASENNGADTGNGSGDDGLTHDHGNRIGKPATPQPGPDGANPSAGSGSDGAGEGGGNGGGNPPATSPDVPEPPNEPASTPRFKISSPSGASNPLGTVDRSQYTYISDINRPVNVGRDIYFDQSVTAVGDTPSTINFAQRGLAYKIAFGTLMLARILASLFRNERGQPDIPESHVAPPPNLPLDKGVCPAERSACALP
jgi:hypothetical protein